MALSEDQSVVQTLPPHRSHEALGEGVCLRGADRRADDAHSLAAEHLIEGARVLGVAITDEEAGLGEAALDRQVAGLLGYPEPSAGGPKRRPSAPSLWTAR